MSTTENQNAIFPKGDKASPDYFTGTTWIKMLVQNGGLAGKGNG